MSRCAGWAGPFPRTGGAPKRRRADYTALLCRPMKSRGIVLLPALMVPGAAQNQGTGCGGAWVQTSEAGRDTAERDRMWRMGWKLEDAIFDLAPEAYCEG